MITIRELQRMEEMRPLVDMQAVIWGYSDPYPARLFYVVAQIGGQVLGAYHGYELVGLALMFYGCREGKAVLHSQLVGVLPAHRNTNIGFQLKLAQRQFALRSGIPIIEWTFDPLQAKNAYLNVHKLGAIVRRYLPNYFGAISGHYNIGIETDRVCAEWYVSSGRVSYCVDGQQGPPQGECGRALASAKVSGLLPALDERSLPDPRSPPIVLSNCALVEVPAAFEDLLQMPDRAEAWRLGLRDKLVSSFHDGYGIVDVQTMKTWSGRRVWYRLEPFQESLSGEMPSSAPYVDGLGI